MKSIEIITPQSFSSFGDIIDFTEKDKNIRFEVLVEENKNPWRIAAFRVKIREAKRLECHPLSKESFTPISGVGIILVAEHESPQDYHAFLLDKSISLKKGIWHEIITLSDEAVYQITENLEVSSDFYEFKIPVRPNI